MPKNSCIMQIRAESGKSALPICNYSQILYQFLTFTQNLKRSPDKCCCHHLFWRINQKSNAHKSFVSFIIYTGNISWNPVLSEHSLLDKPIKERAAVFYCRPLVTYKDWVFSLILLLYPMILTTKEILKILIINLSSNLTYDILFSHLPSRKHYCHYCNHYIQHHNSIQNQIRNISSIM